MGFARPFSGASAQATAELRPERDFGVLKPSFGEGWVVPRGHGLIEHACISVQRQQMATIVRPSPRNLTKVLCIWALEGPRAQQVILSRQILHHEGAEDVLVQGMGYNGVFDSWMVFQAPAVCHLFHAFDLHATAERPILLHSRELVCWQMCTSRNELVMGSYDSYLSIFELSKATVKRKKDEFSLTAMEMSECRMRKRVSWSVGSDSVWPAALCLDENFHLKGYRIFVSVQNELVGYDYETGAELFRSRCHAKITSLDMRRDMPCIVAGNRMSQVVTYSARQGALGKRIDIFQGHSAPVSSVLIDHVSKVCYSLDAASNLCCWNLDHHVLLQHKNVSPSPAEDDEGRRKNDWLKTEVHSAKCQLQLVHMPGRRGETKVSGKNFLLAHTAQHHESMIEIQSHLRYLQKIQSPSPVMWMKCISSAPLLDALGWTQESKVPVADDCVLLAVSLDGTLQVMHSVSGDILAIVDTKNCREVFTRSQQQALDLQQGVQKGSGYSVDALQTWKHKSKNPDGARPERKKKVPQEMAQTKSERAAKSEKAANRAKVDKMIQSFKAKNGLSKPDAERDKGRGSLRAHMAKQIRNSSNDSKEDHVAKVDYVEELATSHGSGAGLLVLTWTSGVIDLINLQNRECVQSFRDSDIGDCKPTCVTFVPQKKFQKELLQKTDPQDSVDRSNLSSSVPSRIPSVDLTTDGAAKDTKNKPTSNDGGNKSRGFHAASKEGDEKEDSSKDGGIVLKKLKAAVKTVQLVRRVGSKKRVGQVGKEMKPYFCVVGNSNGMIKVWTPTTVKPAAVTHKFKPVSIDSATDTGGIVGVAHIEQTCPSSGDRFAALLTVSAKGAICLCRAYTWEPIFVCRAPNAPQSSNAEHDLNTLALYTNQLALISCNDGDLYAWRIHLTKAADQLASGGPVPGRGVLNPDLAARSITGKKNFDRAETNSGFAGNLSLAWPTTDREQGDHHFGQGRIIDMLPNESRFISKSLSTGLLEWFVDADSSILNDNSWPKTSCNDDQVCSSTISLLSGDQFSRVGDCMSRMKGEGDFTNAHMCCYMKSGWNAVLVLHGQEIVVLRPCPAETLRNATHELHNLKPLERLEVGLEDEFGSEECVGSHLPPDKNSGASAIQAERSSSDKGAENQSHLLPDQIESSPTRVPSGGPGSLMRKSTLQRQNAEKEKQRQVRAAEERARVMEAEQQRRDAVTKHIECLVNERDSSLLKLRQLDVIPTPFTIHYSKTNDETKIVESLELEGKCSPSSLSSVSSEKDGDSDDESKSSCDMPRNEDEYMRVRFNASGLAPGGCAIDIKHPLRAGLVNDPKALKEMIATGMDVSANAPAASDKDHPRKCRPRQKKLATPLNELQLEASRRGYTVTGTHFADDVETMFTQQMSLYDDLSRTLSGERRATGQAPVSGASQGPLHSTQPFVRKEESQQVHGLPSPSSTAWKVSSGKWSEDTRSRTLGAEHGLVSASTDVNQNLKAARAVSSVDNIFKENADFHYGDLGPLKPRVQREKTRSHIRPATVLGNLGGGLLIPSPARTLKEKSRASKSQLSISLSRDVLTSTSDDFPSVRQLEHPDQRPGFEPGQRLSGIGLPRGSHIVPEIVLSGQQQTLQPRPLSGLTRTAKNLSYDDKYAQNSPLEQRKALQSVSSDIFQRSVSIHSAGTVGRKARRKYISQQNVSCEGDDVESGFRRAPCWQHSDALGPPTKDAARARSCDSAVFECAIQGANREEPSVAISRENSLVLRFPSSVVSSEPSIAYSHSGWPESTGDASPIRETELTGQASILASEGAQDESKCHSAHNSCDEQELRSEIGAEGVASVKGGHDLADNPGPRNDILQELQPKRSIEGAGEDPVEIGSERNNSKREDHVNENSSAHFHLTTSASNTCPASSLSPLARDDQAQGAFGRNGVVLSENSMQLLDALAVLPEPPVCTPQSSQFEVAIRTRSSSSSRCENTAVLTGSTSSSSKERPNLRPSPSTPDFCPPPPPTPATPALILSDRRTRRLHRAEEGRMAPPRDQPRVVQKLHDLARLHSADWFAPSRQDTLTKKEKPTASRGQAGLATAHVLDQAGQSLESRTPLRIRRDLSRTSLSRALIGEGSQPSLSALDMALLDRAVHSGRGKRRAESPPARLMEAGFERERNIKLHTQDRFLSNLAPGLTIVCGRLCAAEAAF